jgi:hypothetical protein
MAGAEEESALGPVRALWTSKPKTRATVLQMIHGFTQKKKKKSFRDSFELLPLLHRIDIDVGHRSPRIFTTNVESYVAGERQKARIRVGWCR